MSDYGLDMSGMLTKIQNKFRSGNSVPVDRATISRDEFQFLMDEIERLRTQRGEAVSGWTERDARAVNRIRDMLFNRMEHGVRGRQAKANANESLSLIEKMARRLGINYWDYPPTRIDTHPPADTAREARDYYMAGQLDAVMSKDTVRVPDEFATKYAAIKTASESNAHLNKPTDFAISWAQSREIGELRQLIETMLKAAQGEG